jgi:glycosyltransferase involved in cell wall biosynthesis
MNPNAHSLMPSCPEGTTAPREGRVVVRINARLNVGGIARHVAWLSAGLRPAGFETLLVSGSVPPGEDDMIDFVRAQGVEPLVLPEMTREISAKDLLTVWKLYRLFVRVRPDVVHTHAAKAGAVGRLAGLLYRWLTPWTLLGRPRRCRFVHTYHGHIFHSYYSKLRTWVFLSIERILARLVTDRIVVISPQQYREIHETFRVGRAGQFTIIPLGLDLGAYRGWEARRHLVRAELGAGEGDVLVGIVGRLTEIKDHALFLRVAARFRREQRAAPAEGAQAAPGGSPPASPRSAPMPRVRFLVIGNGHLRADLEAQARELGLGEAVVFLGMRNDPENFYPALDVVALTSRNEGTPLTLIEGMANGRAVVATNVGGVVDLLGPAASRGRQPPEGSGWSVCERGVLVRPADEGAFCAGLARLAEDAALRGEMGKRGQDFIEGRYSKDRLLEDVKGLYSELLGPITNHSPLTTHPPLTTTKEAPCVS